MNAKQKNMLRRIIAAAVLMIVLSILPLKKYPALRFILFLIPYFTVGHDILRKAFKGIRNRQVFDENFLMAVATVGAMALGEYTEGVAVMLFYQIGELFQGWAVGKSRRNISELMDIRPDYANLETEDGVEKADPDDVEVGSVILVQPGERVPIDGVVIEGKSSLDTSALTGESIPRDVEEGQEILSGSINLSGVLRVKTTKEFEESTASRILDMVENAGSNKARSEKFITKFARWYTPAVCYGALALAILGPLANIVFFHKACEWSLWSNWIYRSLTFLVISCPCAIVVSIPLTFFGGIGGAGSKGILIKGSNYMETLANVRTVVFDKTGTLTKGNFVVTKICPAHSSSGFAGQAPGRDEERTGSKTAGGIEEGKRAAADRLLEYAALAEHFSNHPISKSLKDAYLKEMEAKRGISQGNSGLQDELSAAEKSGKTGKSEKTGESEKIGESRKTGESEKTGESGKTGKTGESGKAGKTGRSGESGDAYQGNSSLRKGAQTLQSCAEGSAEKLAAAEGADMAFAPRIGSSEEISGEGVITEIDGKRVAAGNLKLMRKLEIVIAPEDDHSAEETGTVVHIAAGREYLGHIVISDEVKPNSADAVRELKETGVKRTIMLTGDAEGIASAVAAKLGIDEYHAQLLPEDKVKKVEMLLQKEGTDNDRKNTLAFVGDGINDAPVLACADIGIAMGAMGSDAAIEAADVVLMDDDPVKIARAIRIARKCILIVKENIGFALGVKIACLILGALGIANMWLAIFADVGVMVLCVLNSIRALVLK